MFRPKCALQADSVQGVQEWGTWGQNHVKWSPKGLELPWVICWATWTRMGSHVRVVATKHDTFNNGRCAENVHVSHPADGAIFRLPRGLAVPIRHQGWNEGCIHVIYHPYPPYERLRARRREAVKLFVSHVMLRWDRLGPCLLSVATPRNLGGFIAYIFTHWCNEDKPYMLNDQLCKGYPTSYSEKHSNQEVQNESTFWSDFFNIFSAIGHFAYA